MQEVAAPPRFALFAPLRTRNYLLLWASSAISLIGDSFLFVALSVLALSLTHLPSGWATVLILQSIPQVLFMLFGGVATDRFRPRAVMMVANYLLAAVVAVLTVLAIVGLLSLWHLYIYALISGVVYAFSIPASNSIIPDLLPIEHVRSANALAQATQNLARFLAPVAAGVVVALTGSSVALGLNVVTLLVGAVLLLLIRAQPREWQPSIGESPLAQIRAGFEAARRDPVVVSIVAMGVVGFIGFAGALFVGIPAFATLVLAAGSQSVGILYGTVGAGALLGALAVGALPHIRRQGVVASVALALAGLLLVLAALATTVWAAVPFLVLAGVCLGAGALILMTLVQTRTPAEVRGRVISLLTLALFGSAPLAYGLAGLVGDLFGPVGVIVLGGALVVLAGLIGLSRRSLRQVE